MRKILTSILLMILLLIATPSANAHSESEFNYEKINPGNPLYNIKRIIEKVETKFNNSSEFKYKLLDRRYKELVFLAKEKRESQIEKATSRYMTQAGEIIDSNLMLSDKSGLMAEYKHILEESRDVYESNSAYWLFLQQSSDLTGKLIKSED